MQSDPLFRYMYTFLNHENSEKILLLTLFFFNFHIFYFLFRHPGLIRNTFWVHLNVFPTKIISKTNKIPQTSHLFDPGNFISNPDELIRYGGHFPISPTVGNH